ncbi:MAG TPA: hypothetical protein VF829_02020 [Candidatus Paceibacterota bacterium]
MEKSKKKMNETIKKQGLLPKMSTVPVRGVLIFAAGCATGALITAGWSGDTRTPVSAQDAFGKITNVISNVGTSDDATTSQRVSVDTLASGLESGAVSVNAQPAGSSVLVESVTVPPPGVWVAVQETRDGELGNVLGATRLHGPLSNVTVNLLRNTEPDSTYAIALYRDGGDGGVFDMKVDSAYVDFDSGERVVAPFRTTVAGI